MKHPEYHLQKQICQWLDYQYPNVLYMSDTVANVKLTIPQAARNKAIQKKDFKCPDLLIFEPKGEFAGLFIELKVKSPFKKNGDIYRNEHLEGQSKTIEDLKKRGYYACFSWSFEMTKRIIVNYLNLVQ